MKYKSKFIGSIRTCSFVSGLCWLCLTASPVIGEEVNECVMPIDTSLGVEPLTRNEKIELLNKRFYEALARFEECMQGSDSGGSIAGAGGQGGGSSGSQTAGATVESVAVSNVQGTEVPEQQPQTASEPVYDPQATDVLTMQNGQVREQLETTNNDAILLEQIRQAAIAEQDPELKKKLWKEYERRKSAAGGS